MQKPSPEPQIGSRTISRVLYHSALAGGMATVIPLGAQLPVPSSNLPGSVDRADPLPYLVLLRTGLAELVTSPCRLVGSYPTVSPLPPEGGGLLSVALSEDHSPWAQRPALWSPDFPLRPSRRNATDAATIHPAPENSKTIRRGAPFHQPSGWSLR